ncbi:MAG TPA: FAD-dependent oxidoreductase, partial [Actinomycetota bacterium]|nr:FAD-dependent oxidoreductase [Actinomycetota bacterium]
ILGPELMELFEKQAVRFGAEMLQQNATKVDFSERPFRVWSGDEEHVAGAVIVATGAKAKMLGLASEKELLGHGVSTCATCDGFFFSDQELVVVGGGDSAMEEALFLTRFASKVKVVHRRGELRASKIMQDRAFENPKVEFVWDSVVTDVLGSGKVEGVRLQNVKTGEESDLAAGGMFLAIGHTPNTEIFRGQLEMDDVGYLRVEEPTTRTSVEGVFAAGDAVDHIYRQAVTAAGMGCKAAIDAERWLELQGH